MSMIHTISTEGMGLLLGTFFCCDGDIHSIDTPDHDQLVCVPRIIVRLNIERLKKSGFAGQLWVAADYEINVEQ